MGRTLAALGTLLLAFCIRFQAPLSGEGVFCARDLHFFFVPLRESLMRTLSAGGFPWLFPENFGGLPLAANPNAAVFWPGTWIYPVGGVNGVILAQLGGAVLGCWWAMRWCGFGRAASTVAALCFLGSGVFQSITCFLNATGLLVVLPLCLAAGARLGWAEGPGERRRWLVASALLLALVILAGEPAMGFLGILATAGLLFASAGAGRRIRRLSWFACALILAVGLAAVQILPAVEQLRRSARGTGMPLESAAGACSVHPARLLTVVLPGSGGDPHALDPRENWLPGGISYFAEIGPGVMPLVLGILAIGDPRGRALLLGSALAAVLSCGTYLPGFEWVVTTLPGLQMLRYPEKWWLIVTILLCAAAGAGVQRLVAGKAWRALPLTAALALVCSMVAAGFGHRPEYGIELFKSIGFIDGDPLPEAFAAALRHDASIWATIGMLTGLVAWLRKRGSLPVAPLLGVILLGIGTEMAVRLPDTIPWGDPAMFKKPTPAVEQVLRSLDGGFFYDEGNTHSGILRRRGMEHGGIDPLRALTGTVFGVPFFADNEIDRMAPLPLVHLWSAMAVMPLSPAKLATLADFGVSLVRVPREAGALVAVGLDRLPLPGQPHDELVKLVVPRPRMGLETGASISPLLPVASSPSRVVFDLDLPPAGADLVLLMPFDPFWRATIDGVGATVDCRFPAWKWGLKIPVAGGRHKVEVVYGNPWFTLGSALSLLSLLFLGIVWRGSGFHRRNR